MRKLDPGQHPDRYPGLHSDRLGVALGALLWLCFWALFGPVSTRAEPAAAAAEARPSIFLEGASVPRAKALALDAALIRGWQIADSGPAHSVFETWLEDPASPGPPGAVAPAQTLLRIRADFIATPAGVNAYLQAEEHWYPGTAEHWSDGVTARYRANLANALASLERQWRAVGRRGPAATASAPVLATDGSPAPPSTRVEPESSRSEIVVIEVGLWAYYAEHYAIEQGCTLADLGAELVSDDGASELHRVHCLERTSLLVRCNRLGCGNGG
ncbi:MAG: hypothetical protein EA400_03805 [Chromatiaceae bacterium]|nr:MAG: hypothetical protein EA400_03805 [Chromatiaceae bacterium]